MSTKREFLVALVKDEASLRRVFAAVGRVVRNSFVEDRAASLIVTVSVAPTEAEVKRRANICYDWFAKLRVDLHYSTQRALDSLPRALRATLDGTVWEPPAPERAWGPPEGPKVTT
jgi:hypothetical protein